MFSYTEKGLERSFSVPSKQAGIPDSRHSGRKNRIVLPLSAPIMATIGLFRAVGLWNSYFAGIVYIRDRELWPVQLVLREIILSANTAMLEAGGNLAELDTNIPTISLQYASLLVVLIPIMCVYPFLQRYFAKGVMLGAVKG